MISELEQVLADYQALQAEADTLFTRVRDQFSAEVRCQPGCDDCCHALFDLSLVEAFAVNQAFGQSFGFGPLRSRILEAAAEADRRAVRLKRDYFRSAKAGADEAAILADAGRQRLACPLLQEGGCALYEARPITCRLYGVPTAINGQAHVCPKCAFEPGKPYPTVALDRIQDRLAGLSLRLAKAQKARLGQLHLVYVPLSMALLTRYDEAWFQGKRKDV